MADTLKITPILEEKATVVAKTMTMAEDRRDIPETPFYVSRSADSDMLIGKIKIGEETFYVHQKV